MGHGQKNANRGAAINRNAARIQKLAETIAEIKGELVNDISSVRKELKDEMDALIDELKEFEEGTEARLLLLERSIWRKIVDKMKGKPKSAGDPASPNHRAVMMDPKTVRKRPPKEEGKGDNKDGISETAREGDG